MSQRVLVLDDEAIIGETIQRYFERHGLAVTPLTDPGGLRRHLDGARFDLVILDLALAEVDGFEVLALLKAEHPGLPVVVLTGMGYDEELMAEAKRLGADAYVCKTLALPQLLAEVRRVIRLRELRNLASSRAAGG